MALFKFIKLLWLVASFTVFAPFFIGRFFYNRAHAPLWRMLSFIYSLVLISWLDVLFINFKHTLTLNPLKMSQESMVSTVMMAALALHIAMYAVDKIMESKDADWNIFRKKFAVAGTVAYLVLGLASSLGATYLQVEDQWFKAHFFVVLILAANMLSGGAIAFLATKIFKFTFIRKAIQDHNERRFMANDGYPIYLTSSKVNLNKLRYDKAFEYGVADLLKKHFGQAITADELKEQGLIKLSKGAYDQGGDVVVTSEDGTKSLIQCKLYSKAVSNEAVQQALAAKAIYGCTEAVVVTNHTLTIPAWELAKVNGVKVITGSQLRKMAEQVRGKVA